MEGYRKVIVTGGSQGIGKATVKRLLLDGFAVHIIARDKDKIKSAVKEFKDIGPVTYTVLDLSNRDAVIKFGKGWSGPLYGLVNNAGVVEVEMLEEKDSGSWDRVLNVNLHGVYFLTKALLQYIEDNGRIVNVASQLGKEGRAGYGAYCASKFAVIGLTKVWAKELGKRGITVNAICPGWVKTEMSIRDVERMAKGLGKNVDELFKEISEPLELKRFTEPSEVANLVTFLVGEGGSGVTGRDMLLTTIWNQS